MGYIQRGGGQYFPESECIQQPIHNTQYTLTYDTDTQYTIQLKRDTETQLTHMILWQKQTSQLEFKRKRKYCYQNFQTCILWKHSLWEKEMIFAALLLQ